MYDERYLLGVHWVVGNVISGGVRSDFRRTQIVRPATHVQFHLRTQIEVRRCQIAAAAPFRTFKRMQNCWVSNLFCREEYFLSIHCKQLKIKQHPRHDCTICPFVKLLTFHPCQAAVLPVILTLFPLSLMIIDINE